MSSVLLKIFRFFFELGFDRLVFTLQITAHSFLALGTAVATIVVDDLASIEVNARSTISVLNDVVLVARVIRLATRNATNRRLASFKLDIADIWTFSQPNVSISFHRTIIPRSNLGSKFFPNYILFIFNELQQDTENKGNIPGSQ